ncbi:hypothetical protein HN51_021460, partial [Arachis hypogaea]
RSKDWDWFINLSASDYPLVTQDDLLYTFLEVDRNLNFIEHTSRLRWKEKKRAMPLIVDPGLYQSNKSEVFWVTPNRNLPTSFRLFTDIETETKQKKLCPYSYPRCPNFKSCVAEAIARSNLEQELPPGSCAVATAAKADASPAMERAECT